MMRYHAFITDYDGTLASNDYVPEAAVQGMRELKATGRKLILVTGRQLPDLKRVFSDLHLFDKVVAENGALLFDPLTLEEETLGNAPPAEFFDLLTKANIPFSKGRVIVAAWQPYETLILDAIRNCGLEYQVIFNKGAVMVLPPAVNKTTGLLKALHTLNISEHNAVAVGDAENDNAMLSVVECAVAVQNALPHVKAITDWTTDHKASEGVLELASELAKNDLSRLNPQLSRHDLQIAKRLDGAPFTISPFCSNILVAGTSGCGKTTLTAAFLEKLVEKQYQFCLIDPEGDYTDLEGALTIGDSKTPPSVDEIIGVLTLPNENVVVCALGIPLTDRPHFFKQLLAELMILRRNTGHPHFIVMDECHHLMPCQNPENYYGFPQDFHNFMVVTTRPDLICYNFLRRINLALIMGENQPELMDNFARLGGKTIGISEHSMSHEGNIMVWQQDTKTPFFITGCLPRQILMRHKRKYASGDMGRESFIFRGPLSKLSLYANNLMNFIQIGRGVDYDTWLFHLQRHDYSNWIYNSVKDHELASEVNAVEMEHASAVASRDAISRLILERYTL